MKGQVSRATRRVYPLTMICAVYRVARSSVYAVTPPPSSKPGPKTCHSDREVLEAIRAVLAACPFHGEGYRKSALGWRTVAYISGGSASSA